MKALAADDFVTAAKALGVPVAAVKAISYIEAPVGGFDVNGLPTILFEGHWFSHYTDGLYDHSHPTISYPHWTRRFYSPSNTGEHARLAEAAALDREAALKSCSWGKFQIMGFNHESAGFPVLQDFINAMYQDEGTQLQAFITFLKTDRAGRGQELLQKAVDDDNWTPFAEFYNGLGQSSNHYDTKLAQAYRRFA